MATQQKPTSTLSAHLLALFEAHRLTPSQRRVAHALLGAGAQAVYLSSTELATLAGVSQPSVTRLARALGFDGYQALRRHIQSLSIDSPDETSPDVRRNELQAAISDEIGHLDALREALRDPEELYELGATLAASKPLVVLGLRASAPVAAYFGFFAERALGDTRVITRFDSRAEESLISAVQAGATWMLTLALPRHPQESLQAIHVARGLGLRIATISDTRLSPIADHSDHLLSVGVGSRLVFDSQSAAMVLCNVLLSTMCDAESRDVQQRLDSFESFARDRALFLT